MVRPARWSALIVALSLGCGDDSAVGDDASASDGGTAVGTTDNDSTAVPSTGSADGTGAPPATMEFARGIRMLRMTANQAVQVPLVEEGLLVAPEDQTARIIEGRPLLIRGFWSLHADFTPRELVGRLVLDYPDGTQTEHDFDLMVDGPSADGGKSFQWLLQPDEVVTGMQFRARILEPDPALATGEVSEPPPIAPLSGRGNITAVTSPLEMRVVLVPVLHQFEDCEQAPEITDADVEALAQQLEQNNPVQTTEFTIREPMPYTDPIGTSGTGFGPVLARLAQARLDDEPDPNVYYYGLLDPCDGFPPGLLGQAIGIPNDPVQSLAQERISTGRWNGSGAAAAGTFVHEVGHSQGRRHVRCSGGEGGVDMEYPHVGGRIGVWGLGIHDFSLRSPAISRDYMTYCSNEWVSDYGWEQTLEIIEVLTSWDYQDQAAPEIGRLLVGMIHEDGSEDWWTSTGAVSPSAYSTDVRVTLEAAGLPIDIPAHLHRLPHGTNAVYIAAPLPTDLAVLDALTLHRPDTPARRVQGTTIRVLR